MFQPHHLISSHWHEYRIDRLWAVGTASPSQIPAQKIERRRSKRERERGQGRRQGGGGRRLEPRTFCQVVNRTVAVAVHHPPPTRGGMLVMILPSLPLGRTLSAPRTSAVLGRLAAGWAALAETLNARCWTTGPLPLPQATQSSKTEKEKLSCKNNTLLSFVSYL